MLFLKCPLSPLICVLILTGCQHITKASSTLSQNQFRIYATQEEPQKAWMSKARSTALGGPRRSSLDTRPQPLFGMNFSEAKSKVVILDIRSMEVYLSDNLKNRSTVKSPVIHLPWRDFFTKDNKTNIEAANQLAAQGVTSSAILLLLGDQNSPSEKVQSALKQLNYPQVLIVDGGYENLLRF